MASEAKASSPTATDADLARVLTRKDEPEDRSDEIRRLREENARLRKWDELTREIDREERNEKDSKHYAQALVQHARQQRAAREAREAREAEKEFKAAEAASSLCITERGAGPHDAFVRAVIKGEDVQIARVPKKNPTVDMAEAEKARKDGNTAIALGNYWGQSFDYRDRTVDVNMARAVRRDDGSVRVIQCAVDPAIPGTNWLDTAGHSEGVWTLRYLDADRTPIPEPLVVKLGQLAELV